MPTIATDTLSLVFILCFLVGFGFFLITALLGSHGHMHSSHGASGHVQVSGTHQAPAHVGGHTHTSGSQQGNQLQSQESHFSLFGYLNPTSFGLFLLGFGLFGYFFHNLTNIATSLSVFLALFAGIGLSALLLTMLNRLFANSEGSTEQDVVDRTGMIGKVSITIPEQGLGEIIYTSPGGMRKSIPARGPNGQRLARDQEVVVVSYQNGVAEVDTWDHFIQEGANSIDHSTADSVAQIREQLDSASPSEREMVMRQESPNE